MARGKGIVFGRIVTKSLSDTVLTNDTLVKIYDTLRIRNEANTSTLFAWNETTKLLVGTGYKGGKVHWIEQKIPKRTGNIRHHMGTDDAKLSIITQLVDGARFTNFGTLEDLMKNGTVVYLDFDSYNVRYSGKYVVMSVDIRAELGPYAMECVMVLVEYNN